eukprot:gb/GFBE01026381.1/.p1 GENE.gb/GFBE01026381.1/~~gb/GFBE01026381.1/.p1  ORF type:complete len:229 (+),score=37.10 gb/GFBE01026381.1/:1-687(+)
MAGKVKLANLSTCRSAPTFSFAGKSKERAGDEAVPGPGKYGVPSTHLKYKKVLNVSFGSSERLSNRKFKGDAAPGPGAYNPFDPNGFSPLYGFGSEKRLAKKKESDTPPPGAYKMPSTLTNKASSFAGKPEGKPALSTGPGPGSYKPSFAQTTRSLPSVSFGGEARLKTGKVTDSPGPGQYPVLNELGGNITTHISPAYSMSSRRPAPRNDVDLAPGPSFTQYSQFGS